MVDDDGSIRFSVKEVLSRIEGKIDVLTSQMQQKADIAIVEANKARISALEKNVQEHNMLVPEFMDVRKRLRDIESDPIWTSRIDTRARFEGLSENFKKTFADQERVQAVEAALKRYKRWILVVAFPAVVGAAWAVIRIVNFLETGTVGP